MHSTGKKVDLAATLIKEIFLVRTKTLDRQFSVYTLTQWRTQEFFSGGVQQIQLRTDGRENGDLGAVAP